MTYDVGVTQQKHEPLSFKATENIQHVVIRDTSGNFQHTETSPFHICKHKGTITTSIYTTIMKGQGL